MFSSFFFFFFFFNDTATTEIYTLSLHDALPISFAQVHCGCSVWAGLTCFCIGPGFWLWRTRSCSGLSAGGSGEHTSELPSQSKIVCRLLLGKKKKKISYSTLSQ